MEPLGGHANTAKAKCRARLPPMGAIEIARGLPGEAGLEK